MSGRVSRGENPRFVFATDRELFVIRWSAPSVEAVDQLTELIVRRHEQQGRQLVYVAIVPTNQADMKPDEATRARIMSSLAMCYPHLQMVRILPLGSGLRLALIRSGMVAMTLTSGLRGQPISVDKSVAHTAEAVASVTARDPAEVIDWFVREGLVRVDELGA